MKREVCFIDANVPMYAVGSDHPLKEPCVAILQSAASMELLAVTDTDVLQEILHRYTAMVQRNRAVEVTRLFLKVVPEVLPVTKKDVEAALELHQKYPIMTRDSVHAAVMRNNNVQAIISADHHFDLIPGLRRIDPEVWHENHNRS